MKKSTPRLGHSNLPVPKASKGSPGNAKSSLGKGSNIARSAEDIPRRVQLSVSGGPSPRRAMSPGMSQRSSLASRGSPSKCLHKFYTTPELFPGYSFLVRW